jgi:hypothetical protein
MYICLKERIVQLNPQLLPTYSRSESLPAKKFDFPLPFFPTTTLWRGENGSAATSSLYDLNPEILIVLICYQRSAGGIGHLNKWHTILMDRPIDCHQYWRAFWTGWRVLWGPTFQRSIFWETRRIVAEAEWRRESDWRWWWWWRKGNARTWLSLTRPS